MSNDSQYKLDTSFKIARANWSISNYSYMPFDRDYMVVVTKKVEENDLPNIQDKKPEVTTEHEILWVDDHPENNKYLIDQLQSQLVVIVTAQSNAEARALLLKSKFDIVISDIGRDKEGSNAGLKLLEAVKKTNPGIAFIFYTSPGRKEANLNVAAKQGALLTTDNENELLNFLEKRFNIRRSNRTKKS